MELEDIEGKLVFCLCILNYTDEIFMAIWLLIIKTFL